MHIVEDPFEVRATVSWALPPFAQALYNALFNATAKRIGALPVGDQLKAWPRG